MNKLVALVLGLAAVCAACNKDKTQAVEQPATVATTGALTPPPAPPSTEKPADTKPVDSKPTVTLADIPSSLKTDAYEYFGLSNEKPLRYFYKGTGAFPSGSITFQMKLKAVADGKASFEFSQTGGPMADSFETVSLEPDGVYAMAYTPQVLKTPHCLELPTDLTPGKTWPEHQELEDPGSKITIDVVSKVVGVKEVKTGRGMLQALEITGTGTFNQSGNSSPLTTDSWYVKGLGTVKQQWTISGKQPSGFTLTLAE